MFSLGSDRKVEVSIDYEKTLKKAIKHYDQAYKGKPFVPHEFTLAVKHHLKDKKDLFTKSQIMNMALKIKKV